MGLIAAVPQQPGRGRQRPSAAFWQGAIKRAAASRARVGGGGWGLARGKEVLGQGASAGD
jgi:hypothetical protein